MGRKGAVAVIFEMVGLAEPEGLVGGIGVSFWVDFFLGKK